MSKKENLSFAPVGNGKQNDINVYIGGRLDRIAKNYSIGPFMRDFYAIDYCLSGAFTIYIDEKVLNIKAGDFYIIPPNTPIYKIFTETTSTIYVGAKGARLSRYLKLLGFSDTNFVFPYKLNDDAVRYFNMLIDSLEVCEYQTREPGSASHTVTFLQNPDYSNYLSNEASLRQTAHFSLFLAELMNIYGRNKKEDKKISIQQKYIDTAVRYIETNYPLDITVDSIAAYVGLTRSYLFKLFRESLGMSVNEYIIQTRMRAACDFLCQPDVQVKTVAASVGYEPYNFSKMFKKFVGVSPTEYKQKNTR